MNSSSSAQHHHHHHTLGFGQLPPTTYETSVISTPTSAQAPITVDTSSPPLGYGYQPSPAPALNGTNGTNGGGRRGPGSIKWTKEGVSTSAERRLPFVHRFRPVDLPPPVGLVQSASVNQNQQVNPQGYTNPKAMNKMAQIDTNPVGALQERYQSRGILPNYRVVQFEGMSHNPVFTYQVNIGDMNAIGTGNSKKQAKHAAARAMLDKLDGRAPAMTTPTTMANVKMENPTEGSQPASNGNGVANNAGAANGNSPTNPIGCLQEYCVKCSLPMPIYDLQNTSGQPHQRNFEIVAKVGSIMSTGVGSSKKDAKREAAVTLLERLKALGSDVANQANGGSGSAAGGNDIDEETLKQVANMKIETLTPKHSKVLQDFYKKLQNSGKDKLLALHRTSLQNPKLQYVQLLQELGHEQAFDVTYVDIEEKTASGEEQCLVQLSTMPVAVCHGTGPDQATANHNAARNALEYLKLMTKRSVGTNAPKDATSPPNKGSNAKKANGK